MRLSIMVVWLILSKHFSISSSMTRLLIPFELDFRFSCRIFWASCADLVKSATPSREPLLSKTVLEPLDSHGSSMTWYLSCIPHYQHILLPKPIGFGGWLRLDTVAAGFFARTTIFSSLCVVAMSV